MLDEFKKQYIDKCINGNGFDEELNSLFEQVLTQEFGDNHEKMDDFVQLIIDAHSEPSELEMLKQENQNLKQQIEMTQGAIMDLADMILSQ